jgi:uncharacterized protein (DUF427 family)
VYALAYAGHWQCPEQGRPWCGPDGKDVQVRRIFTRLAAVAALGAGMAVVPAGAALASSATPSAAPRTTEYAYYFDNRNISMEFFPTSGATTFEIWHFNVSWHEVGNGSIIADHSTGTWTLKICDDKADGIGPYIDRDGGSYGASGNGTCSTVVTILSEWKVRWDGYSTPWQPLP